MAVRGDPSEPEAADPKAANPDISVLVDGIKTMGAGILKAFKGVAGLFAGVGMGASGLGYKDIYDILNAPFQDWRRLWRKKRKELGKEKRTGREVFREGALGVCIGLATGLVNALKDVSVGGLQASFGGIFVVKILKSYFGLDSEIIRAILKTGHPIGLMVGAIGKGIDVADALCRQLEPELRKYESLGATGQAALDAIQEGDIRRGIEQGAKVLGGVTGRDFSQAASQLGQAAATGQAAYRQMKAGDLEAVQQAVGKLGVDPKKLVFEQGKILLQQVPAEKRVEAIQAILKSNPKFGVIARAASYEDALNKLMTRGDLEIIDRLTAVNLKSGGSLSPEQLQKLKKEAREGVKVDNSQKATTAPSMLPHWESTAQRPSSSPDPQSSALNSTLKKRK